MTAPQLLGLVDKLDTFEIIRDQIAALLAIETAGQVVHAIAANRDPAGWAVRVYAERSNPWGEFVEFEGPAPTPIVNVRYTSSRYQRNASNVVDEQRAESTFLIDVYTAAASTDDGADGHLPGDEAASRDAHRVCRLMRNYLMAAVYTYLGLEGVVGQRFIESIETFELADDNRPVQRVGAARLTLTVLHQEFSPQVDGEPFEQLSASVTRGPDGEFVFFTATFDGNEAP